MLKVLKVNAPDNDIGIVSDFHWSHDRDFIWGKREFKNVQESNEELIHRWNAHFTDKSIMFHLGDMVFNDPFGENFKNLMRRLKFKQLYCLLGNHNSGQSQIYKETLANFGFSKEQIDMGMEVYPLSHYVDDNPNKEVIFLPEFIEAVINGQRVSLCHYPIISHHKAGHGSWMLCGHSHGTCEFTNVKTGSGLRLDMGIESFGRPLNFKEIKDFFKNREITSFDHHSEKTT